VSIFKKKIIMESIKQQTLIKADGSKVQASEALAGKSIVCLYFSAHWCPPCRKFTPILKDFYEEVQDNSVEIIFVSSDSDSDAMMSYMKESHGDWYALEHGSKLKDELDELYEVEGIPTLVVLEADGSLITSNGRATVQSKGPKAVEEWKNVKAERVKTMESIKQKTLIKAYGSKIQASQALSEKDVVGLYFSAHWCPPCKTFTPVLKEFYEKVNANGDNGKLEIIFMSADKNHDDMISYMKESHGDWYALEHDMKVIREFGTKYNVGGIPTLVVLKGDGTLISANGRSDVETKGADALKEWIKNEA
jgi:nucleoredoxin